MESFFKGRIFNEFQYEFNVLDKLRRSNNTIEFKLFLYRHNLNMLLHKYKYAEKNNFGTEYLNKLNSFIGLARHRVFYYLIQKHYKN